MAINFIQQKKKQKKLLLIVGAVIVITVIVLWFGFFRKQEVSVEITPASIAREIEIDFQVLENPFLQEIQTFEKPGPFENGIGRENPFLPY